LGGHDNNDEMESIKNVTVKYYSNFKKDSILKRRLWNYGLNFLIISSIIKKAKKDIQHLQGDLIWYSNSYAGLKLLNSNKDKNAKHILDITEYHDLHTNIIPDQNFIRSFFNRIEVNNFNKVLLKLDVILFITNNLQEYYKKHLSSSIKTTIFPMIVDYKRFTSIKKSVMQKAKSRVIRYMGSFSNEKDGIDILIKAFARLSKEYTDISLELAGGNHTDKKMQENLINTLKVEDKVKYVGMLDRNEVPHFLSGAIMLVLARPNSKQAEGGFPTKLGEYLASGIPVCCTHVGEIPDYLKDKESVFFAEPGSVDSFMNAMKYVIDNPNLAHEVAVKGRLLSENTFGADKQVKKILEYFKNIIGNN
jgi:glycosyltransferase involved in cell wall biosynthesis